MARLNFIPSRSTVRYAFACAFVASLIPLGTGTAAAQPGPRVRVTVQETPITSHLEGKRLVLMMAPVGTVLEVIHTEGDRYVYRPTNSYWVLLPRDEWGTQRAGWISGRDVEHVPPAPREPAPEPVTPSIVAPRPEPEPVKTPDVAPPAPPVPAAAEPKTCEVVLTFKFGKSDLSDEAKQTLADAVATLKANPQNVSFALEGHADWTGPEPFNEKLGLARAETVKRYLAEQHEIPADKITVVSYGERQPAASNATREGRAQNRRVVVKGGS